jgi:hypothetical protein
MTLSVAMLSQILVAPMMLFLTYYEMPTMVVAFQPSYHTCFTKRSISLPKCTQYKSYYQKSKRTTSNVQSTLDDHDISEDDSDLFNDIIKNRANDEEDQNQLLDELSWRSKKVSLEEADVKRFKKNLKSKPWKLPYEESRKWVRANFWVATKEEFLDLVENGNLRTPYVPKDPEKYYSDKGTWVSWNHFLYQEGK